MSSAALPLEIRRLILDHLALPPADVLYPINDTWQAANRSALFAYAGASQSFRVEAHHHLFSSLILEATIDCPRRLVHVKERILQLAEVLTKFGEGNMHGTIAQHAKSFGLFVTITPQRRQRALIKNFLDSTVVVLNALHAPNHGITSVSFGAAFSTDALVWAYDVDTNIEFRRAFENLLRSPNMKHVKLDGISMIPRTLLYGTSIRDVEFYSANLGPFNSTDLVRPDRHGQSIIFESLGLDEGFPLISMLQQQGDSSCDASGRYVLICNSLRQLQYRLTTFNSLYGMIDVASHAANTLKNLQIQFSAPTPNSSTLSNPSLPHYRFDLLPNLHSLQISIRSGTSSIDWQPDVIHAFHHILNLSILPGSLKKLTLEIIAPFVYQSNSNMAEPTSPCHREEWRNIAALLGLPHFECIDRINIVVRYCVTIEPNAMTPFGSEDFLHALKMDLETVFPGFGTSSPRHRNLQVLITTHDLGADNNIDRNDFGGLTFRCGGSVT